MSGINLEFYDVGAFHEGKFTLQLDLWDKEKRVKRNFINVYGAAQEEDKIDFLTELAGLINKCKESCIIGGISTL
jgi:hypothetical protein